MEKSNPDISNGSTEIKSMLNKLYNLFLNKFKEPERAWNYLIEFITIDNSADIIFNGEHNIEWLFEDKRFRDSVFSVYDTSILKSEYYDHLGDFYFEIINKKPFKKTLPDKAQTRINALINEGKKSIRVLDLDMGTGRNLMAIHEANPNMILFGVTNDLNQYRIALVNTLLFGIKSFLLHADKMKHELGLNIDGGIVNWKRANQWSYGINELIQNLN